MEIIYILCAVTGATLLVCQFLLALLGFGGHHDVGGHDGGFDHDASHDVGHDHDAVHDSSAMWFVGVLTFRTIVAALTFFGLAGLAGTAALRESTVAWKDGLALGIALAAGLAAMFGVAAIMRSLYNLRSDGTIRIERAVGKYGTVYLRVPGEKKGLGKVTVNVQNRSMEYQAVTSKDELPTGAKVVVVAVVSPDTVEVLSATTTAERADHV